VPDKSISEEPVRVGVMRTPARAARVEGKLNGRTVVTATEVAWTGPTQYPMQPPKLWLVDCVGLPGEDFSLQLIADGSGVGSIEAAVQSLTELTASAILREYPLETQPERLELVCGHGFHSRAECGICRAIDHKRAAFERRQEQEEQE
jgi:hypothetical protein